ncbi:MAG: four helix bundle protein [Bacteroidales bacterium]|nr:four helix bundle protein [Bacteroidales bacterium]
MEYKFAFERLDVWKLSRVFVKEIYTLLQKFPRSENFNLRDQIQRATISTSLNIAEGSGRSSFKEQARFSEIAYSSLMEVYCALALSKDLGYITEEDLESYKPKISELSNKINALKNSQLKRHNTTNN